MKHFIGTAIVLLVLLVGNLFSEELTLEKSRVVILNTNLKNAQHSEITDIVIEEMGSLGRFEVIDRRSTEAAISEMALGLSGIIRDDQIVELGNMLSSKIGMTITTNTYSVKSQILEIKTKQETNTYIVYVADLSITIKQIDIETGTTIHSFVITTSTGKKKSIDTHNKAIQSAYLALRRQLKLKLRELYPLVVKIIEKYPREVLLIGGENIGIVRNLEMEVVAPDYVKQVGNREINISGGRTGLVLIKTVDEETSTAIIMRGFNSIKDGQIVKERLTPAYSSSLFALATYQPESQAMLLDLRLSSQPYKFSGGGVSLGIGQAQDSQEETVNLLRWSLDFRQLLFRSNLLYMYLHGGGGSIKVKGVKDSEENDIEAHAWQGYASMSINLYFTEKILFYSEVDYHLGGNFEGDDWSWLGKEDPESSEDNDWLPAVWSPSTDEREINLSGLYVSAGLKFIF
ncbi:MAG: hypothetical protein KAI81_04870 [Candidatus Marinimicrobia bacterium]|nr:hypothetical protein [Candidatus Neomarinimicrobiota bacterium]